jgi:hypothetical protein
MKKHILLGVAFLGFSLISLAQKANWEKVTMSYIQLPLKPVAPMAKKYSMEVIMDAEGVQQGVRNSRQELINSITQTNQILAKQGKPQQIIPEDDNYYAVTRDGNAFKSAIKLDGCQEVASGSEFSVVVKVVGFNLTSVVLKQGSATANGVTTPNYAYNVTASYIVRYEVYDAANSMVRQETVTATNSPTTKTTKAFLNQWELEAYWNNLTNKNAFLVQMDDELHRMALNATNTQLDSELGFPLKEMKIDLATFDDTKKFTYPELRQAFADASMGFNYMSKDKNKSFEYLRKAIAVWEKEVATANPNDKKARINENIQQALWINLAKAYFFLEDWEKTNNYIVRLKAADKSGSVRRKLVEVEDFKEEYEARVKANKI